MSTPILEKTPYLMTARGLGPNLGNDVMAAAITAATISPIVVLIDRSVHS